MFLKKGGFGGDLWDLGMIWGFWGGDLRGFEEVFLGMISGDLRFFGDDLGFWGG